MSSPFKKWKLDFLEKRNINRVTGENLYSYRMTDEEYEDLQHILQSRLDLYLQNFSVSDIAKTVSCFPDLLVLYAAEWWRRSYSGNWSWDPILSSIGIPLGLDAWPAIQRYRCIEEGLAAWGIEINIINGTRRYLGTIAQQAGLPMKLLSEGAGSIGRLLSGVLTELKGYTLDDTVVLTLLKVNSNYLPQIYRNDEILLLLADVIRAVLRLSGEINYKSEENIVRLLDKKQSSWRNLFPLPIDDDHAKGLLSQLFKQAVEVKNVVKQKKAKWAINRQLELLDGKWVLSSEIINFDNFIEKSQLKAIFKLPDEPNFERMTLRFVRNRKFDESYILRRQLGNHEIYRILGGTPKKVYGHYATSENTVFLEPVQSIPTTISKGFELNPDLPWLFKIKDSNSFHRQGGGGIPSKSGLVCIPDSWKISIVDQNSEIELLGHLSDIDGFPYGKRAIWKITGQARISDGNNPYRISTDQRSDFVDDYELSGIRNWNYFIRPQLAYAVYPRLVSVDELGVSKETKGLIEWRVRGKPSNRMLGPVEGVWPARGIPKWRQKMVLLPQQNSIFLYPDSNTVSFHNWGLSAIKCLTENVSVRRIESQDSSELICRFIFEGKGLAPEWCDVECFWKDNPDTALIRLPFPSSGVHAIDENGTELPNRYTFTISQIIGKRIIGLLGPEQNSAVLRIRTQDPDLEEEFEEERVTRIYEDSISKRIEIRLVDYIDDIRQMLAGTKNIDSYVRIILEISAHKIELRISKFDGKFTVNFADNSFALDSSYLSKIDTEKLQSIIPVAQRIDSPREEPVQLIPDYSEQTRTGVWRFPADVSTEGGPWLIYPKSNSQQFFRPLAYRDFSLSENSDTTKLAGALSIYRQVEREEALKGVIEQISADYNHQDWSLLETLADQFGHLPLMTLDIWGLFAQSQMGMVALALRPGKIPPDFLKRFVEELPFLWECIPFSDWVMGFINLRRFLRKQGTLDFLDRIASALIKRLVDEYPAMRYMLSMAKNQAYDAWSDEEKLVRQMGERYVESFYQMTLANYNQNLVSEMVDGRRWPEFFQYEVLMSSNNESIRKRMIFNNANFMLPVQNVPILLAYSMMSGVTTLPLNEESIRNIKTLKKFNPEWFLQAYDLTVTSCFAEKLMKIE